MCETTTNIVEQRALAYDEHYRTAGWCVESWTRERIENFLAYAPEVEEGGNLNGNEMQCALRCIGAPNLGGKTILDYCCGTGITAIYFALCGAHVYAFDRSQEAISIAVQSAKLSGVEDRIHFSVEDARNLPFATESFDAAFCQSALHIIIDYPECPTELARVLKLGAKVVFCEEGLGYNPLLKPTRYIRRRKYRECGGRPLKYSDIAMFGQLFSTCIIHHFNLLLQAKSVFRGHLRRHGRLCNWVRLILRSLQGADRRLLSIAPWLERWCGAVVVEYIK